ncbi:hypothetical protein ACFORL_03625 [Legionella dresdenensis]|uniref:Uncharacterized protein n=1 Tax=Legionella dresdenensis TaxID=450200 RepID=A0ABV8CD00_9GAMM
MLSFFNTIIEAVEQCSKTIQQPFTEKERIRKQIEQEAAYLKDKARLAKEEAKQEELEALADQARWQENQEELRELRRIKAILENEAGIEPLQPNPYSLFSNTEADCEQAFIASVKTEADTSKVIAEEALREFKYTQEKTDGELESLRNAINNFNK